MPHFGQPVASGIEDVDDLIADLDQALTQI
jgi:O-acetylhomoserine/O-acetylserine sulfhydrylase-like pyridoxal-dependent enzyme